MSGLHRELAPISEKAWERIEQEAREVLELHLAARRLFDFEGPFGWDHSAVDLGRVEPLEGAGGGSGALVRRRVVQPLIELRVPFELERDELERIDRGAATVDLDRLRDAARAFAAAEDTLLFDGYAPDALPGLVADAAQEGVALPEDSVRLPDAISEALARLRETGVSGPYAVALGPHAYAALDRAVADGGYPIARHVERLIDRPVVWAPCLRGGVVVSLRGGDFKFVCGRDAAIGYLSHDDKRVHLFLEESFGVELSGPDAAVPLLAADGF
jgi:uncharacterized linocin/CFP29 family protein